jgi:hypothetical protein
MTDATGLYLYGVVAADAPVPDGDDDVRLLAEGDLAAIVSRVPLGDYEDARLRANLGDQAWLQSAAWRHEAVLEALSERFTVVPMRLCTVFRDEAGVREMLVREHDLLADALERLRGRSEWAVKVIGPPRSAGRGAGPAEHREPPGSGSDYLRRRLSEMNRRRDRTAELLEACARIHDVLSGLAADATTLPPQRREVSGYEGEMLQNGAYLVENERRQDFLAAFDELAEEHAVLGIAVAVTGPWPAYNFIRGSVGAAA